MMKKFLYLIQGQTMEREANILSFRARDPEKDFLRIRIKQVEHDLSVLNTMLCNFQHNAAHEYLKKMLEKFRHEE